MPQHDRTGTNAWRRVLLAAGCAAAAGCSAMRKPEIDPFMTGYSDAASPPSGVVQTQFEERFGGSGPPQGVSITDELVAKADQERSFADRVADATDDMTPEKTWLGMRKLVGQAPNETRARAAYAAGDALFREKKYDQAARKFKSAAWWWPDSTIEEDSLFMLGESYFFADRYPSASDAYANLLKKYDNSRHLERTTARQFAIGHYWDQLGRERFPLAINVIDKTTPIFDPSGNAIANYESVRLKDPTGPLADDALMATANAHLVRNHYEDASYHYDILRKDYPQSDHQAKAHLLGIQAKLKAYQGAQYDGTHLEEANKLVDQSLVQFPTELQGERERLLQSKQQIRIQSAQREWEAAEYYFKNKYYGAAAGYYRTLVDDFADTPYAQMAQERLEATKDLPPSPPDRFAWLAKLFGEAEVR